VRPVRVHWFARLGSTNDAAARMRRAGALFAPALVLAGAQVAGRGRGGNAWWSGDGCITATLAAAVQERFSPHQLPLLVGLALRNAVADITADPSFALKWPNDVLHRGRKLAGILCERVDRLDLVGIGLNVNLDPRDVPAPLRARVTSLSHATGREFDKTAVLSDVVRRVHAVVSRRDEYPFGQVLREYNEHHALRGRRVTVTVNDDVIRGTCTGLDGVGRLVVRDAARRGSHHRIVAGQVQVR
jgi:BirA family biotin operon repressor/biotin-[acetyl-CoA-carboxylase] ligase